MNKKLLPLQGEMVISWSSQIQWSPLNFLTVLRLICQVSPSWGKKSIFLCGLFFFSSEASKEGRQQPATTCQLSSLPPYLSSFLPPHYTVSVLIVGLSYEARNVLSYTRRRMQNFLAFRDSPIIPLRRLPLVPSWTFWFLCFSLFVTTEEDSAFEARHAYPDMMLVSAPWVGDIHRVVLFRFSISTLVQMTQRRGIFG